MPTLATLPRQSSPANKPKITTPEDVHAMWIDRGNRVGFSQKSTEAVAAAESQKHRRKMLGQNYYCAINAAHFMAACLRMKRMPRSAERFMAQHALKDWLPHIPQGERREILATLRRCTPAQLGPDLVALIANEAAE